MLRCEQVQAALSARLDGEPTGLADDVIDAHVAHCEACRAFYERAAQLNRRLTFAPNPVEHAPSPDLSEAILQGIEPQLRRQEARRSAHLMFARLSLGLVAVGWGLWAVVSVMRSPVVPNGAVAELDPRLIELFIEAVAIRCAIGFGLAMACWLPRLAGGMLPVFGAMWMFTFGFVARDVLLGQLSGEASFRLALLLASLLMLVWTWLAHSGAPLVRQAWNELQAKPSAAG